MKNWYQIPTHVNVWYKIITDVNNWYLIVTDVSDKTLKNAKCSSFRGHFINLRNMHVCYIIFDCVHIFLQSVRYRYEICDVLISIFHVLGGICTDSSKR